MIELSNLTAVTLQPGQAIPFDNVLKRCGRCECWNRQIPTSVRLRANAQYDVSFSGNISGAAGDVLQLSIAIGGSPLVETAMNSISAAAGDLHNISTKTVVSNCCCDLSRLSVVNTGTTVLTVAPNSAFLIERRA